MGPSQALSALKEAIAMGADEAILLNDKGIRRADTWATAYTLSRAIKKIGEFDLISAATGD
jgi:electron transfer flavoprotein alpha/beta subunit